MVMVQLGVSLGEAMARMRADAYAEEGRLGEVARDIVTRRMRHDPEDASCIRCHGGKSGG